MILLGSSVISASAHAEQENRWLLQTSVYTAHFSPDSKHDNHQELLDLEYQRADRWLAGAAVFRNSFNQPAQYVYGGKYWRPFASQPRVHVKVTAGLVHGYKGEYRDKIPLNSSGIAPAIIPSIGLSGRHASVEVALFGTAGAILTFGVLW